MKRISAAKKISWWRVLLAYLLDTFMIFLSSLIVIFSWGMFCMQWGIEVHSTDMFIGKCFWRGLGVWLALGYFGWYEKKHATSIGKSAVDLKIVAAKTNRWNVFGAYLIDFILMALFCAACVMFRFVQPGDSLWFLAWSTPFVYFTLTEGITGSSVGKKLFRIRVRNERASRKSRKN